jgi:hypothetical protein
MPAHEDPFEAARLTINWALRKKKMEAQEPPKRKDVPIETICASIADSCAFHAS